MKTVLLQRAIKLYRNHRQKKWWQRTVRAMATVVVFCTTYALILPAITMEQEPVCGLEAHVHEESCYTQQPVYAFVCTLDDEDTVLHSHDGLCYDAQGKLICPMPEVKAHTHDDSCYALSQEPVCGYVHVHSDACATLKTVQICGQETIRGHVHSEACTTQRQLVCTLTEGEGHSHTDACGTWQQTLICTEAEGESHTHSDGCYEATLIPCQIPEAPAHTHDDSCYALLEVPCPLEAQEAHTHTEACYAEQMVYCDKPTPQEHVHEERCYAKQLVCGLEEMQQHRHEDICYASDGSLICEKPQIRAHAHSESCLVPTGQMQKVLTCQLEEHTHEESCYPVEEENNGAYEYICGLGIHAHVETCYDEAGQLICTIPEHAHEAACIVAELDLTADVETELQWKESLSGITLTGNWPGNVLAVAETQLDYKESEKNLILAEGVLKGYTRYGAWYGQPYADWNAMFASFCINYAGVQDFPLESDAARWTAALAEKQLYRTPDTYAPKPGDLIFFDFDQKEDALEQIPVTPDAVGIVAELVPAAGETPARIKLIAGDQENRVSYVTCDADDITIVGYGYMPSGDIFSLTYEGADFTVTVTLDRDAMIPETAQLAVREILPDTEEYNTYYQQSAAALNGGAAEAEETEFSFARFFDISFVVDGVIVEPAAPVDVQIRYSESIAVKNDENGMVVHFADEGVEVLDAHTYSAGPVQEDKSLLSELAELFTDETQQVDTFRFTQSSFSVSGTIVTYAARAVGDVYYAKEPTGLDASGGTQYLIYAKAANGRYYAIHSTTYATTPVEITFNADGSVATPINNNMLWTLKADGNAYLIQNVGSRRYLHSFDNNTGENITTGGAYSTSMVFSSDGEDVGFLLRSNNDYAQFDSNRIAFTVGQSEAVASTFFLAAPRGSQSTYHVWFDGTNGGLMNLYGSDNTYQSVSANNNVITLPSTWKSPTKYPYALNGWYDIVNNQYYAPGAQVTITQNTVFYADWMAASYDVGQNNEHTVESLDTSDFITTYVFDYNTLFNVQSLAHIGSISATGHSESWTILNSGKVPYQDQNTLGFMFVDYDSNGDFSYAHGRDNTNISRSQITSGVLEEVTAASGGKDLLDLLFNPATNVIGKKYVGEGNYLFQYMDSTTPNYDGVHDGYYYLDARLNAASYNKSDARFYLYDYLERTSDSAKDGGGGQYSDFLPFNSPYIFGESDDYAGENNANRRVDYYEDTVRRPGWEYDAKDNLYQNYIQYSENGDAITNYFFGIRTDIEFFLPNAAGYKDEYDNYGNISTRGEHMVFDFHGDDDVWVFVDGELLLDIGGMHGIMHGSIDFSTGTITYGTDGNETVSTFQMSEGTHTMSIYYMERGSSQSNCAIYFNIAPRYDLEITKEDIYSAELLDGAEFTVYTCEGCANTCVECLAGNCTIEAHQTNPLVTCDVHGSNLQYAELWPSQDVHNTDMDDGHVDNAIHTITTVNGKASCWGLSAGKTYYIKETLPPQGYDPGYPRNDDVIRITLNNRGTATIETTTLHGTDGQITEGYAVIEQSVDNTLKIVSLTITNQRDEDTTQIRVKKVWDAQATDLPNSITAYLTVDGKQVGRPAVLTEANGWTYTWTGLPEYKVAPDGTQSKIQYRVGEIQVSGFNTEYIRYDDLTERIEWVKSDAMEDSATYLLLNGGRALAYNGSSFYWMTQAEAQDAANGVNAQWAVTTNQYGFRLTNGSGYSLTYSRSGSYFYGSTSTEASLNQVIYYLDGRLVAHDNDKYYQMNLNGAAVSADGLVFSLIRKDIVSGTVVEMKNTLVDNENQTFVDVNKVWDDNKDHSQDSVTVHLYADGKDTGRYLVLSNANGWKGSFDGLPYYAADGKTPIVYTVLEDEPPFYDATYESETLPGVQIVTWIKQEDLSQSGTYRIVSGANALAIDGGVLTVKVNDATDQTQWWTPLNYYGRTVLKAYSGNYYLYSDGDAVYTVTNANTASTVSLTGEVLKVGNTYLQMTRTAATVSDFEYNATLFTVALRTEGEGKPGTGVTVTNIRDEGYVLPQTGGIGTILYTFSGLLMIAVALMYRNLCGRKQRKGARR